MTTLTMQVQTALYAALHNALQAHDVPVFDAVPQDQGYPYVSIDTIESAARDLLVTPLQTHFVYLSVWSEYRGKKEVLQILDWMHAALHRVRLNMSKGHLIDCEVTRSGALRDSDGVSFTGNMTVQIRTVQ